MYTYVSEEVRVQTYTEMDRENEQAREPEHIQLLTLSHLYIYAQKGAEHRDAVEDGKVNMLALDAQHHVSSVTKSLQVNTHIYICVHKER